MQKYEKNEIIGQVLKYARNGNEAFVLCADGYHYHFIQERVGTGKYLYCHMERDALYPLYSLELNYRLAAIYTNDLSCTDDCLYIINNELFGVNQKDILPDNIYFFDQEYKCAMDKAIGSLMTEFYDGLDAAETSEENVKARARQLVIRGEKQDSLLLYCPDIVMTAEDFAGVLCGVADFREMAYRRFQKKIGLHMRRKAEIEAVNKLFDTPEKIMDVWEFTLAKVLNEYRDVKFLTVEFTRNGRTAQGKMSPFTLQCALDNRVKDALLRYYHFDTSEHGENVLKALKETIYAVLRCEDISKITYKGKVLYRKNM